MQLFLCLNRNSALHLTPKGLVGKVLYYKALDKAGAMLFGSLGFCGSTSCIDRVLYVSIH